MANAETEAHLRNNVPTPVALGLPHALPQARPSVLKGGAEARVVPKPWLRLSRLRRVSGCPVPASSHLGPPRLPTALGLTPPAARRGPSSGPPASHRASCGATRFLAPAHLADSRTSAHSPLPRWLAGCGAGGKGVRGRADVFWVRVSSRRTPSPAPCSLPSSSRGPPGASPGSTWSQGQNPKP